MGTPADKEKKGKKDAGGKNFFGELFLKNRLVSTSADTYP